MHKILNIAEPDQALQKRLSDALGVSCLCAQLLINRGMRTPSQARRFLDASVADLHDPSLFDDMEKAVGIVRSAADSKKKVMIFGDYDADGITSTALLKQALGSLGIESLHYVPHRVKEGYGLNAQSVRMIREKGVGLLITVDCGISNTDEIRALRAQGIEVIVTDHHEVSTDILPPANAILNPKVPGCRYPFRHLAGVGVAFKFCQAFSRSARLDDLDVTALGTIADSAPLIDENRVIAREGLARLQTTSRHGLQALMASAGFTRKKFDPTVVSFFLAPRINASGRIDDAHVSLQLLLSDNADESQRLASVLESHNRQRQKIEAKILEEALDIINRDVNFKDQRVIVIAKENWHQGVLGIVASKIADQFYRPAVVISLTDGMCKGSARSIKNFHLFEALCGCSEHLASFGGHSHAAGLVISRDNIDDFRHSINRRAKERLSLEHLLPGIDIDVQVALADITDDVLSELERMEPFGQDNPEPLFYADNLAIKSEPRVMGKETLKFWVTDGQATCQAIGFGMAHVKGSLMNASSFGMAFRPRLDTWGGVSSIILEIKELVFR